MCVLQCTIKSLALDYRAQFSRRNVEKLGGASRLTKLPLRPQAQPHCRSLAPISDNEVSIAAKNSVPKTTEKSTIWSLNLWEEWKESRKGMGAEYPPTPPHFLSASKLNDWMCKFILEVRRKDGAEYPPNSLYQIACGIMRHVRMYEPAVNFFTQPEFDTFRRVIDSEMKRLKSTGKGVIVKRAESIDIKEEEILWSNRILGDSSPQSLLDTMVYMCGYYFALRSGQEHRDLQFS